MNAAGFGCTLLALLWACPSAATPPAAAQIDPLSIRIDRQDAERFAALMRLTAYRPTAAQVQQAYLDGSGRGVSVFTPSRIEDAANLARAIAAEPDRYRHAVETCLPLLGGLEGALRATYLGYRGLLPQRALPSVHVVFGAANSGGTASSDAQVLGLEVLCGPGTTGAEFARTLRAMFAHETVHSWQTDAAPGSASDRELLLYAVLREGVADYLATLVTGEVPDPSRDQWARAREAWLWAEFEKDRQTVAQNRTGPFDVNATGGAAIRRWVGNYRAAPAGWPHEAGYWVGMRIAEAYVARSQDRIAAIEALLRLEDPGAILSASGYGPR
jgi:Predicted Zn-dependent protease (DUF2268)